MSLLTTASGMDVEPATPPTKRARVKREETTAAVNPKPLTFADRVSGIDYESHRHFVLSSHVNINPRFLCVNRNRKTSAKH